MNKKEIVNKVIKKLSKKEDNDGSVGRFVKDLSKEQERKERAKTEKLIQSIIRPFTTGIYRDEHWAPIQEINKKLQEHKIDPSLTETEYYQNSSQPPRHSPDGKKWYYEVPFSDMGGWKLTLTSHFGPSTVDQKKPNEHLSDAYDLTFSLGWDKNIKK